MEDDVPNIDFMTRDFAEFNDVPLYALRTAVRKVITKHLNIPADVATADGYLPDYTGLAEKVGFEYIDIQNFGLQNSPAEALLSEWRNKPDASVGKLCAILQCLERLDILTDIWNWLERDVAVYREKRTEWEDLKKPIQDNTVTEGQAESDDYRTNQYRYIVTEDAYSATPVCFDAFVCYAGDDITFVKEAIRQLENPPYNIRLCIADRDMLPGGSDHTLSAELIESRCRRMLVILSENYLKSPQCDFQTKFAHALAPGSRSKKVIPVLIESCTIPNILRFVTLCDYTKQDLSEWFWRRLAAAIQAPLDPKSVEWSDRSLNSIVIDLPPENIKWDKLSWTTESTTLDSSSLSSQDLITHENMDTSYSEASTANCSYASSSSSSSVHGSPKGPARKTTIKSSVKRFFTSSKC